MPSTPQPTPEERMELHSPTALKRQQDAYYRAPEPFLKYLLTGCQEGEGQEFIPFGDAGYDPGGSGLYSMAQDAHNRIAHPEYYEEMTEDDNLEPVVPERMPFANPDFPTPEERENYNLHHAGLTAEAERFVGYAVQFADEMADFIRYAMPNPGLASHWLHRIGQECISLAMAEASNEGREEERRYQLWNEALKDRYPETYRR